MKGHGMRYSLDQGDDAEGQGYRHSVEPEGDDTVGSGLRYSLEPMDEQGMYLVEVDSEEDVTGQGFRHSLADDDVEGQRRQ